jgi:hypothetical protein
MLISNGSLTAGGGILAGESLVRPFGRLGIAFPPAGGERGGQCEGQEQAAGEGGIGTHDALFIR